MTDANLTIELGPIDSPDKDDAITMHPLVKWFHLDELEVYFFFVSLILQIAKGDKFRYISCCTNSCIICNTLNIERLLHDCTRFKFRTGSRRWMVAGVFYSLNLHWAHYIFNCTTYNFNQFSLNRHPQFILGFTGLVEIFVVLRNNPEDYDGCTGSLTNMRLRII